MPLNHSETFLSPPSPWKDSLPWNQSPGARKVRSLLLTIMTLSPNEQSLLRCSGATLDTSLGDAIWHSWFPFVACWHPSSYSISRLTLWKLCMAQTLRTWDSKYASLTSLLPLRLLSVCSTKVRLPTWFTPYTTDGERKFTLHSVLGTRKVV